MNIFQPGLTIRYHEERDEVLVQTHSLDGRKHDGTPHKLKQKDLPTLLFQLVDRGYQLTPVPKQHRWQAWKEVCAYSPEYVQTVIAEQQEGKRS